MSVVNAYTNLIKSVHSFREILKEKATKTFSWLLTTNKYLKIKNLSNFLISHSKEEPSPKGDNETEVKEKLQNKKRVVFLILGFLQKLNLLKARGIIYLFDIQSKIFNYVYDGNAVIAQAHTGTGKTFSFAIPLIEKLQSDALERKMGRPPKVLVLTLTRELAKKIQRYNQKTGNSMLYGGTAYNPQIDAIRNGIDILEGTPGYIKDHLRNNKLNLSKLKHVVLDEADHMLDVSFAEQVEEILVSAYKKGSEDNPQTLLFSATCPNWVYDVAKKYMRTKFEQVELIGKKTKKTTTIAEHLAIGCHWSQQAAVIGDIIQVYSGILVTTNVTASGPFWVLGKTQGAGSRVNLSMVMEREMTGLIIEDNRREASAYCGVDSSLWNFCLSSTESFQYQHGHLSP
uniref:DEAD (Asp-Glu-Ala-Asp) box helicase 21 n=1 Tax=Erpetoichthys calabaricus TaxID=27687 RepID=A0A8C4TDY4_ERPCA